MTNVQFWFDPVCPWTYVTYRWLAEARQVRDLTVTPRLLSLYLLNLGRPDTGHREIHAASRDLERFLAWVRDGYGNDLMERAYDAISVGLFIAERGDFLELVRDVAKELDLPVDEATAAACDQSWDPAIASDHQEALALVGVDVGSPVIAVAGTAFFGPVLSRAPAGEAAGRLWDGCLALASHPDFFELKRSRGSGVGPVFDG
ncbi:MAG: hypothetical protein LBJ02_09835 [Bifidobacteriaceae bacterium]|jgi:2-hydroxychromene-2-carboxylate isomerase|nr:hypothetical protein [Bifidobacteriaceae bacterium]